MQHIGYANNKVANLFLQIDTTLKNDKRI